MPMMYFTPDNLNPSEETIELIKQIAYTYRVIRMKDGTTMPYCLN